MTILVKSGPEIKTLGGHNSRTGWNFEKRKTPQVFSMIAQQSLRVSAKSIFFGHHNIFGSQAILSECHS